MTSEIREAAPTRIERIRRLLTSEETFASSLLLLSIDILGPEAILGKDRWAPETLRLELRDETGVELPKLAFDRLMVAVSLVTTDDFFRRLPWFVTVCNVLSGSELTPVFDPADAAECAWGMTEALLLQPPEDDEPFSEEIRIYLGKVLDEEGIVDPPDLLRLGVRAEREAIDPSSLDGEDPLMFEAGWDRAAERGDEIKAMVEDNLTVLMQQLESLPLTSGKASGLLSRMRAHRSKS